MSRRWLIPEVVQSSATDCGPATLKALCAGFGVHLSYGRLREACQTDVDGTSIDTLEALALQLGIAVEQRVLPPDLLLLQAMRSLPAIVVTTLPDGATHFVVVWRAFGRWLQVMDPAAGRLWVDARRFVESMYVHQQAVPREDWQAWTQSGDFAAAIDERLAALGLPPERWPEPAHQDAALRLAGAMRDAGRVGGRSQLAELTAMCRAAPADIPAAYWSAQPLDDAQQVLLQGAVLLSAAGGIGAAPSAPPAPALARLFNETPPRIWAPVFDALRSSKWSVTAALTASVLVAPAATVLEALLLRSLLDAGAHLELLGQRLGAGTALLLFVAALAALEWAAACLLLALGRRVEFDLRMRFAYKIPRLGDRYFQSRALSDMAYRVHWLQLCRQLPELACQGSRLAATLVVTAVAIAWLVPQFAAAAWLATLLATVLPLLALPALNERDLRVRETSAALGRLQLDAMQGARAIEAHAAQRTLAAVQDLHLRHWAAAVRDRQRVLTAADGTQAALALAPILLAVLALPLRTEELPLLLLLVYWAVSIPVLGRDLAASVWQLSAQRSTLLRFLEPLGAPDETTPAASDATPSGASRGVGVVLRGVCARAAGNVILDGIDLQVRAGEHVAVVGASGAGKSALVGLLLGWFASIDGEVLVDGEPLGPDTLASLRRATAWIDPEVALWRASVYENIAYGSDAPPSLIGATVERLGLQELLARLPDGLQTLLSDGGSSLSGGEAQRLRIARAFGRDGVRLAILDEATRGLDRAERAQFVALARQRFADATMFYVSHDIRDTLGFDRVIVMQDGRIAEQGAPAALQRDAASHYRHLLDDEQALADDLWGDATWQRWRIDDGRLVAHPGAHA